jgi:hypothetical protein
MMSIMESWANKLPPFRAFLRHKFEEQKTSFFNSTAKTKAVPLKMLRKELFAPTDQDNKDSTPMLEELAVVAAKAWIEQLLDPSKGTFQFMSDSGGEYSCDRSTPELRTTMLGMVAVNDLAESSFAGVTANVQAFGRVGIHGAAAVSDVSRNGFLSRPTTRKEMKATKRHGLFHDLPEELKMTAVMAAMEQAPATRVTTNDALIRQREAKRQRDELVKREGLEKASHAYIECLIYHRMYHSDRCWKTAAQVKKVMKSLKLKKDKEAALRDNINMRFKGLGFKEAHTTWSKNGKKKTLPQLQARLIEVLKITKDFEVPDKPPPKVPQRKEMPLMGTRTNKVIRIDEDRKNKTNEFNKQCRVTWREMEDNGEVSVLEQCQHLGKQKLDATFIGKRIEHLSNFDIDDKGENLDLRWCGGVIEEVSDGTWIIPGKRRKCYKEGEAAKVY